MNPGAYFQPVLSACDKSTGAGVEICVPPACHMGPCHMGPCHTGACHMGPCHMTDVKLS